MKVLQINSVCGVGSTGRIATDIHNILIEHGHESYIAYGRDVPRNCDTAIKIGNKYDNYAHVVLTRTIDKHGFGSKKATKKFINELEELNPDVIHLHNIHGYYINIEILFEYLKKVNKPVIWTLHDCWAFTGHCAYFDYVGCDKWKNVCSECPQKKSYPSSILFDLSEDNFYKKKELFSGIKNMTIVTPSNWLARLVEKSFLGKYPVKVINNGIDLEIFKPSESNFRKNYRIEDKFIILGVANVWDDRKGYDYFIELSNNLRKDELIVLVGLTEQQKKNLPDKIFGICRTNSIQQLAEIYTTADVFINPTLEDNFPTTNLESLACGTPIITFNTGGSVESVDENTGFVIEKGNIQELLNGINHIKTSKSNSYFERCLERANRLYDKNNKFKEYISMYSSYMVKSR